MKTIEQTNRLLNFKDFLSDSKIFIETGTCYGRSVEQALKDGYEIVLSVEAKDELYNSCIDKFAKEITEGTVQLFYGESTKMLPEMLEHIKSPAVFWLDAHPSGKLSAGHDDLMAKGENSDFHQHNILKKELEIVLNNGKKHIIMIDDQNGNTIESKEYVEIMSKANPDYKFYWYDEQMGTTFYKDKVLIAIP